MRRVVGLAFTAVVVLVAIAAVGTVIGEFRLAIDLALALIGVSFLAGSALSLVECGQRIHQLVRFALADVRDGRDVGALAPGSHWLRVEAGITAQDETVRGVLDGEPSVAATVEGSVRERFAGLPWPSTEVGTRFEQTDAVPAVLDRTTAPVTLAATGSSRTVGHDVRVVGGDRRELTVSDDVSSHTRETLAAHGVDVEADVFSGSVFEHYVRLTEAAVPDGGTVRLFGPVTIETDACRTTLTPGGRFASRPLMTTSGWGTIPWRICRRLGVVSAVAALTGGGGTLLLWLAVDSLLG
ncbi:hypothetical protein [Halomicrobium salinisoli]|uniref:hypothetical protein n=1 Tax=Halomicrobium salinisoli TaxID=2878391 RepID=UPI001CF06FCD|nr:hypothetical protein [Halomicrobium salinisoli]